ncbi:Auxin responsive SAUR protein [Cynara cardunculus var. scolymus]|uniref:Auxin responsive SAUR protein n=2 Tax=Cynara cardunculus var. scolymus TaxID=59895 RepID=A0A103XTD2_CYNCS|nr:Auxin responsive SAUR protein [Cynara cardunculus var. scolymus]
MLTPKKLVRMARKWRREAAKGGPTVANKGHFVVYTADHNRFVIPLHYLNNNIFRELLKMSEDEFGLPTNGPITLPCDSSLMNYLVYVFERSLTNELEALLVSIATNRCYSLDQGGENGTHVLVYGF